MINEVVHYRNNEPGVSLALTRWPFLPCFPPGAASQMCVQTVPTLHQHSCTSNTEGPASFFYYTSFISQLHHLRLNLLHTLSICIFSSHFLKTNERIFKDDENGTKRLQTNRNLESVVSTETCSTTTSAGSSCST